MSPFADLAARRARLARARLYLVTDARPGGREPEAVLEAALRGGADVVQLRDKTLGEADLLAMAARFRAVAHRHGALFALNDRPDLAAAAGADLVHVGQGDGTVAAARAAAGPGVLVGRSTHSLAQALEAAGEADHFCVGPVHATPTKAGRPAVGVGLVAEVAAAGVTTPWFAIGGLHAGNVADVLDAGAERVVVVRAIAGAADPEAAARTLRQALDREAAGA